MMHQENLFALFMGNSTSSLNDNKVNFLNKNFNFSNNVSTLYNINFTNFPPDQNALFLLKSIKAGEKDVRDMNKRYATSSPETECNNVNKKAIASSTGMQFIVDRRRPKYPNFDDAFKCAPPNEEVYYGDCKYGFTCKTYKGTKENICASEIFKVFRYKQCYSSFQNWQKCDPESQHPMCISLDDEFDAHFSRPDEKILKVAIKDKSGEVFIIWNLPYEPINVLVQKLQKVEEKLKKQEKNR